MADYVIKGKGYSKEKISEITGIAEKLVAHYMSATMDEV